MIPSYMPLQYIRERWSAAFRLVFYVNSDMRIFS